MKHPRVLVVFYSRSGRTRILAHRIAEALIGDIEEIRAAPRMPGFFSYLQGKFQALFNIEPPCIPMMFDPFLYDIVVVGCPGTHASLPAPVRAFLNHRASRFQNVAYFTTSTGFVAERSLWLMSRLAQMRPMSCLAVSGGDVVRGSYGRRLKAFLGSLMQSWSTQTLLDPTEEILFKRL